MIYLFCGPPGVGKTLSTVHMLDTDEAFKDRPIYVHGIPDLELKNKHDLADPAKWFDVPDGSVVVIDEAWRHFPARMAGKDVPECVQMFAEHRHRGLDVVLATQDPNDLDIFLRRRVNRYYQIQRPGNLHYCKRKVFEGIPTKENGLQPLTVEKFKYPKQYFGRYKSTVQDTHKKRLPKMLWISLLGLVAAVLAVVFAVHTVNSKVMNRDPAEAGQDDPESLLSSVAAQRAFRGETPVAGDSQPVDLRQSLQAYFTPRVDGQLWSAPAFDELRQPTHIPRLYCVFRHTDPPRCLCHAEGGTRVEVQLSTCTRIAHHGQLHPFEAGGAETESAPRPMGGGI